MQTGSVESVFARSWQLLTSNWVIILPGIVAALVSGAAQAILCPSFEAAPVIGLMRLVAGLITLALTIVQVAFTTGMAGAAWGRGVATLSDGWHAFEREGGHVLVAMVALWVVGLAAAVLSFMTLGLAGIAYLFFFIYTLPSAVVGDHRGVEALAESCRIAMRRALPTAVMVVLLFVVLAVVGLGTVLLSHTPIVGPLIGALIVQVVVAYVTLVVVGEYLALREASQTA